MADALVLTRGEAPGPTDSLHRSVTPCLPLWPVAVGTLVRLSLSDGWVQLGHRGTWQEESDEVINVVMWLRRRSTTGHRVWIALGDDD
jgi:hypothetical protein